MSAKADVANATPKQQFLTTLDREHRTTMRVLRAYPADQLDMRPHPTCRTARELAWVFVVERGLGTAVYQNQLQELMSGEMPEPPESWDALLEALEDAQRLFRDLIDATPEEELHDKVSFFVGPKQMGEMTRFEWLWFLLHDEIHHRGQFSIYLRMAGGKVPSIYGPTADEPWM
ncbi:MAG: DinB family protein [Gemmatimonadetes bacterium]|nr:DinB family protein [Gemmatimonadota bacterium]